MKSQIISVRTVSELVTTHSKTARSPYIVVAQTVGPREPALLTNAASQLASFSWSAPSAATAGETGRLSRLAARRDQPLVEGQAAPWEGWKVTDPSAEKRTAAARRGQREQGLGGQTRELGG